MEQSKSDVRYYKGQQDEAEAEITNLEHEMEGVGAVHRSPPKSKQRNVLATQYQKERIKRRTAKDAVRLHQPLLKFVESEAGTKALNQLKQTLGELRKEESNMAERIYTRREAKSETNNPDAEVKLNRLIKDWKRKNRRRH